MSEQVGFAGQIGPEHISQVVEKGFKSVINNRPDMEGGPEQPTSAELETTARAAFRLCVSTCYCWSDQ